MHCSDLSLLLSFHYILLNEREWRQSIYFINKEEIAFDLKNPFAKAKQKHIA